MVLSDPAKVFLLGRVLLIWCLFQNFWVLNVWERLIRRTESILRAEFRCNLTPLRTSENSTFVGSFASKHLLQMTVPNLLRSILFGTKNGIQNSGLLHFWLGSYTASGLDVQWPDWDGREHCRSGAPNKVLHPPQVGPTIKSQHVVVLLQTGDPDPLLSYWNLLCKWYMIWPCAILWNRWADHFLQRDFEAPAAWGPKRSKWVPSGQSVSWRMCRPSTEKDQAKTGGGSKRTTALAKTKPAAKTMSLECWRHSPHNLALNNCNANSGAMATGRLGCSGWVLENVVIWMTQPSHHKWFVWTAEVCGPPVHKEDNEMLGYGWRPLLRNSVPVSFFGLSRFQALVAWKMLIHFPRHPETYISRTSLVTYIIGYRTLEPEPGIMAQDACTMATYIIWKWLQSITIYHDDTCWS